MDDSQVNTHVSYDDWGTTPTMALAKKGVSSVSPKENASTLIKSSDTSQGVNCEYPTQSPGRNDSGPGEHVDLVPDAILLNVLNFLPAPELFRAKGVSKRFQNLIKDHPTKKCFTKKRGSQLKKDVLIDGFLFHYSPVTCCEYHKGYMVEYDSDEVYTELFVYDGRGDHRLCIRTGKQEEMRDVEYGPTHKISSKRYPYATKEGIRIIQIILNNFFPRHKLIITP